MKRFALMIMAALIMLPQAVSAQKNNDEAEGLKVMSYNIRLGSANDGTNAWPMRYPATLEMIEDQAPDVFGVQEALSYQIYLIEENFRNYQRMENPRMSTCLFSGTRRLYQCSSGVHSGFRRHLKNLQWDGMQHATGQLPGR